MGIKLDLKRWDGKSAKDIGDIYQRYFDTDCFISDLIMMMDDVSLQKGATWLLKHHIEQQHPLTKKQVHDIYCCMADLEQWESKLHILQSLPYFAIQKRDKKKVEAFLRKCLVDINKFVRAWAYNGFYELAMQYPEYQQETKQFLEMAMRDEAPSVKSRVRNIMKKGF